MTKAPVVYVLEGLFAAGVLYMPIIDREGQRVIFRGPSGKAQAITFATTLSKLPTYDGLAVHRQNGKRSETVWNWTRKPETQCDLRAAKEGR